MATTITTGTTTITPTLVTGWQASQESRNIVHTIIGRSTPDVTLKPANMRTGTLEMLFETAADADEARIVHMEAAVFTLTSSELAEVNMAYVVAGTISSVLEDETRRLWTLSVDFQEVDA